MTTVSNLPDGFASLEPFVAQWALSTSVERDRARVTSSPDERQAFYDAVMPQVQAVLAHLDGFPIKQLKGKEQTLMDLILSLPHVSLAVEVQRDMEEQHALQSLDMVITRSATDPR